MTRVHVELGPRAYDIVLEHAAAPGEFARFVRESLAATWIGDGSRSTFVITDRHVEAIAQSYLDALGSAGFAVGSATIEPGEASKSLGEATRLYELLAQIKADRSTCVVAIGGGVVGDLAGFVAATYARGLPLVMVPTTLLAQVDSSVGGKVGVNLAAGKNLVGAFHQPVGVWIDLTHLQTLPDRERRCGLAEVVKYGMILDAEFFEFLERSAVLLDGGDLDSTRQIVARSCELKAGVVSVDEYERTGIRAVLNFGHTIGHAIESVAGYGGGYQHGEAVAVGMVAEARLAERLGRVGPEVVARLVGLLGRLGLPTAAPGLNVDRLVAAMALDKKNQGGEIRFVLPDRIGSVAMTAAPRDILQGVIETTVAGI